jgi:hypothetical protein
VLRILIEVTSELRDTLPEGAAATIQTEEEATEVISTLVDQAVRTR